MVGVHVELSMEKMDGYDWVMLLTREVLDHPYCPIEDEVGWCDYNSKILYIRCYKPTFYDGLARTFKRLTPAQWWQNFNGYKVAHELGHLAYWLKGAPDLTHQYFGQKEWWTMDHRKVGFKTREWVYSTQRIK